MENNKNQKARNKNDSKLDMCNMETGKEIKSQNRNDSNMELAEDMKLIKNKKQCK